MKSILLLFIAIHFISCQGDNGNDALVVDLLVNVTFEDKSGVDLLNPSYPDHIKKDEVKVYYEINGKRETYQSLAATGVIYDNPSGFLLISPTNTFGQKYSLEIFSNPSGGKATTIIELAGRGEIKLVTDVSKGDEYHRIDKIWYNDNLVWPIQNNAGPKYVKVVLN